MHYEMVKLKLVICELSPEGVCDGEAVHRVTPERIAFLKFYINGLVI